MGLNDKFQEYRQRREAKAFFNQHNSEKAQGMEYLLAFVTGLITTIILGIVADIIGINLWLLTVLIAIVQAQMIRKVLNKSGKQLGCISVVSFLLGIVLAHTIYAYLMLPVNNFTVFIDLFQFYITNIFTNDFRSLIIYAFSALISYMSLNN
ncbi:hypothetical protein [Thomasclavelia sp.]|uniref:hypothetical protein n=1 Tax=Thomasclavelia sp. TaxID=3025757 RepID=UPI0025F49FDE|nr:hypothetical protein [Thomasclavelia sp.]